MSVVGRARRTRTYESLLAKERTLMVPDVWMTCTVSWCRIVGGMCQPGFVFGGLVPRDNYQLEVGYCRSLVLGGSYDMSCDPDDDCRLFLGYLNVDLDDNYHLERELSSLHGWVANCHLVVLVNRDQLDDSCLQAGSC